MKTARQGQKLFMEFDNEMVYIDKTAKEHNPAAKDVEFRTQV